MSAWTTSTLGEIADQAGGLVQTGPFGSQLHEEDYRSEGVPVVMPKDINEWRVSAERIARIPEETAQGLERHRLAVGDIVYGRRGDIGRQALITSAEEGWLCGTGCLRVSVGRTIVDPTFLHYYLRLPAVIRWISNHAIGATLPNLNTSILRAVPITRPPFSEQRRIVEILSAYDDLIEDCERRIRVLGEMPRALYREWFINLRYPGHENFPLLDPSLRRLPQGWLAQSLESGGTQILDGDWIETKDQGGGDFRLLQISNVGVGCFVETGNFRHVTTATFERLRCTEIVPGDLLVARMPTPIGRAWLVTPMPWRMITAVDVAIVRPDRAKLRPTYLVQAWNEDSNLRRIAGQASGTTRLRITRRELAGMQFLVPPIALQERFEIATAANSSLIPLLWTQIDNLRKTRDLLLPRLLSGQLSIADLAA